jgi:DNA-binding NarL/FixJ family response regulator
VRTILIVDDQDDFRSAARALLEAGGFAVVGDVADGASAVVAVRELRPEIVLLDIQLPGLDGFGVAERLSAEPGVASRIIFTSSRPANSYCRRLRESRAVGFLAKSDLSGRALSELLR